MKKIIVLLILSFFLFSSLAATCASALDSGTNSNVTADFSASPRSGAAPLIVEFTDNSEVDSGGGITSWSWNFGDGGTSSQSDPTHTYNNAGTYAVSLTVHNSAGSDTTTKSNYITVTSPPNPPVAAFSPSSTSGNVPLTVRFTDRSTGSPASWSWNFGDGSTSNLQNPSHTYNTAGVYTTTLIVSNNYGSSDPRTATITVTSAPNPPVAAFSPSPTSGNAPLTVRFTDRSTGSPASWSWNFGDGSTSNLQNPSHIYNSVGVYTATLTVSNNYGSSDPRTATITVTNTLNPLVAAFSASPTSGNAPLAVTFADQSTGSPTSWSWNFGDGSTSNLQNPTHTYNTAGTYTVNLTATNSERSDSFSSTIYVSSASVVSIAANFNSDISSGTPPLTVQFNDLSTGNPTAWYWDFGDGTTSTIENPIHTYQLIGTYTVTLNASTNTQSNSIQKINYITVGNEPTVNTLESNFNSNLTSGTAPLTVQFNDLSTGNPTAWYWDFGDGTYSNEQNPTHTYSVLGKYTVTLNVSNADQQKELILSEYITVTEESEGSSSSTGDSSSSGMESSPEPTDNIENELQVQRYVVAGNHIQFEFTKQANNIYVVEFDAKRTLGKIRTTIEQLKERSVLTTDPMERVIKHINIWVEKIGAPQNIENATIGFIVSKNTLKKNDIDESTVILQRFDQGKWNPLNTTKTGEDEQFIYYKANTTGFSSFAITSSKTNSVKEIFTLPVDENSSKRKDLGNGQLSIQDKQSEKSESVSTTDWNKNSGIASFFISFIVVLIIGLFIKEKMK